ncbi:MAG TPA: hypothetical protein VML55_24805 [Planctomycetaceae bacterium]|nr:hypothetical protein [Planctomycetaceae bacterium]
MDLNVKPLGRTCAASGDDLVPGSDCFSALVERDGQLVRLDFAADAWTGPPDGALGFWRTRVPESAAPNARQFDAETLLRYFEQLSEDPNPAQERIRYVLALALLKKRRLRIESTRQDGETQSLELAGTRSEGPFIVRDLQLSEQDIEQLQTELNSRLAAEWP